MKCYRCKINYVPVKRMERFPLCWECTSKELNQKVDSKKMEKLFDIPEEYYKENNFLRDIKLSYLRYGELSKPQIDAFTETVEKIKNGTYVEEEVVKKKKKKVSSRVVPSHTKP